MTSLIIITVLFSIAIISNLLFLLFGHKGVHETVESYYKEYHPQESEETVEDMVTPTE